MKIRWKVPNENIRGEASFYYYYFFYVFSVFILCLFSLLYFCLFKKRSKYVALDFSAYFLIFNF
jgi:hypothetical protein